MGKVTVKIKHTGQYTQEFSGYEGQACDVAAERIKEQVSKHLGVTQTEYCPLPTTAQETPATQQAQEA